MIPVQILVVEDEPLIRMVTADMLDDAGFGVVEAANATEAMAQLRAENSRFQAVIIDIGLPDRPGDVLAREIRHTWPELPIVIATGHDRREIARLFTGHNHVGVVGKPYGAAALVAALSALGVTAPQKD